MIRRQAIFSALKEASAHRPLLSMFVVYFTILEGGVAEIIRIERAGWREAISNKRSHLILDSVLPTIISIPAWAPSPFGSIFTLSNGFG